MTNHSAGRTIARNVSVLMASQVITWVLALAVTFLLPRYLGAANLGRYQLAASIWATMAILITFGMDTLLTKEISRDPAQISALFFTSVVLRVGIFLISFLLVVGYAQLTGYPRETKEIIYIVGLAALIFQFGYASRASLQGLERMEFISLSDVASKTFLTTLAIILLLKGYGLLPIATLDVAAAFIGLVIQYVALSRIHPLQFNIPVRLVGWMLKNSFSYLVLYGFQIAYSQIDVLIISLLVSEKEIGWYSASIRLTGTFVFIPTVLISALLPALSRMHQNAPEASRRLLSKSFDLLLLVCVPIGLGVTVVSNQLVSFIYGPDFVNSGPILMYMGIVIIFFSLNMLLGQFFISSDRQNVWTVVMAAAMLVTVPLDLLLIPWCQRTFGNGALGGAISYLATEGGMFLYGLLRLPQGILNWKNGWLALRVILAGLAMTFIVWPLRSLFILVPVSLGMAVYVACILLLRVIPPEDSALIRSLGISVIDRLRGRRVQNQA